MLEDLENLKKTQRIKVGVLRGGPSGEYEISIKTGAFILENLPKEKYHPLDIFIDKKGGWHWQGVESRPYDILKHTDVIFNGLHGDYGEDGKVQRLLENLGGRFTGSRSFPSALAMNKVASKKIFEKEGLTTPKYSVFKKADTNYLKTFEIYSSLPKPIVIKPATAGSSLGVKIVSELEELTEAVNEAFKYSSSVLAEECIRGKEVTCGVVEGLKENSLYPLPPVEIRPVKSSLFDYEAKYDGETEETCPAKITAQQTAAVQDVALTAHKALHLRHYSRTDMIISEDGKIYILEINTLPGLTEESLLPKSLKASGCSSQEFIEHLITLALYKK